MLMKKLFKSNDDKVFTGLIGGLGEHFDTDPVLLRVLWLLMLVLTGLIPGLIIYLVASALVPRKPKTV